MTLLTPSKVLVTLNHGGGERTIQTVATSLSEATKQVCDAENALLSAVLWTTLAPMTASEIRKRLKENKDSHFFDRKTMRGAGQTVKDFKVQVVGGEYLLYSKHNFQGFGGVTKTYYNPFKNEVRPVTDIEFVLNTNRFDDEYISKHINGQDIDSLINLALSHIRPKSRGFYEKHIRERLIDTRFCYVDKHAGQCTPIEITWVHSL